MEITHVSPENTENEPSEAPKKKFVPTTLEYFSKLTKGQDKVRINAGTTLIKNLILQQNEENRETELQYAIGRLVRGAGSQKNHARSGFYVTLVALLNLREDISVDNILEHVGKQLQKSGQYLKSENADICTGQVLVCGAILRSTLFLRSSEDDQRKVIDMLLAAGKERAYLTLASYYFIVDLLNKVSEKQFNKIILPSISQFIIKDLREHDIDSLYLLLATKRKFKHVQKQLVKHLGTSELIVPENFKTLTLILTAIPRITALNHPVFDLFVDELLESDKTSDFLIELDDILTRSSRSKLFVVITIVNIILTKKHQSVQISNLLTNNLIQEIINNFRQISGKEKDNEFKRLAHKLFESLLEALKGDNVGYKDKIGVLKKLLFYPGTFIFEKITKSKLIQQITGTLDVEGVKKLAKLYRNVILLKNEKFKNDQTTETWLNNDRLYSAHLLVKLLNHGSMHNENDWKFEQLKFLMHLGLLRTENSIGSELAALLKEAFFHSLDLKLSKLEDLRAILSQLFHDMDSTLSQQQDNFRNPLKPEEVEIWRKTAEIVQKIESKKSKSVMSVFHTLFLHMGLQLFSDAKLASDSLTELFSCYERVKREKKAKKVSGVDEAAADGVAATDELDWIEVVTDLFLSLLSHNSHLLRSIINRVFPHLCKYMTSGTIHQILSVLDPKNEDNPLTRRGDVSDEDGDSDDEADQDEANGEINNEESEDEDDSESEDDAEEDETQNDKLRMALHKVLISNGYQSDQESVDLDQLSETEGEKLDEALAAAFKQFKPNRGRKPRKQSKDDETLTHFRLRVLDLVDLYLDSNPSMLLVLEIMLPLLQTLEFSIRDDHQRPLQVRLQSCLKKLSTLKKFDNVEGVDGAVLSELLSSLLDKGTKNVILMQHMSEEISECSTFIVKCSEYLGNIEGTPKKVKKHLKRDIAGIISGALETFFRKRDCLTPVVLFKDILQKNWDGAVSLVASLGEFAFDAEVRPFRRTQALELLRIFYTNHRFLGNCSDKIAEEIKQNKTKLLANIVDFFDRLAQNSAPFKISEKYATLLMSLIAAVKSSPVIVEAFDWKNLGEKVREYRSGLTLSSDAKKAFNKLCSVLGIPNVVQMKKSTVKLSTVADDDNSSLVSNNSSKASGKGEKTKKKKKNKHKNQKEKKEARQLRLQSLSEGLKVEFSAISELKDAEVGSDDNLENSTAKKRSSEENGEEAPLKKIKKQKNSELNNEEPSQKKTKKQKNSEDSSVLNGHVDKPKKRKHKIDK